MNISVLPVLLVEPGSLRLMERSSPVVVSQAQAYRPSSSPGYLWVNDECEARPTSRGEWGINDSNKNYNQ